MIYDAICMALWFIVAAVTVLKPEQITFGDFLLMRVTVGNIVMFDTETADAHADIDATTTQVVDGGEGLGRRHRVKVGDHEHARPQPSPARRGGEGGEHHQRVMVRLASQALVDEPPVQNMVTHP